MKYPFNTLKLLKIGLLALCISLFLPTTGAFAMTGTYNQNIKITADDTGLFVSFTPTQDYTLNWHINTDYWYMDNGKGPIIFVDWPSVDNDEYLIFAMPLEKVAAANDTGSTTVSQALKAGKTYKFHLFKRGEPGDATMECATPDKNLTQLKNCIPKPGYFPYEMNDQTPLEFLFKTGSNYFPNNYTYYFTAGTYSPVPTLSINYPADESVIGTLPLNAEWTYKNIPAIYDRVVWHMESAEWTYTASKNLIGTSSAGTTTWALPQYDYQELPDGAYSNDCYFEAPDGLRTKNLCPDYTIYTTAHGNGNVATGTNILPRPEWTEISTSTAEDFYDNHSDFATPTSAFSVIFSSIEPFYGWTKQIANKFSNNFSPAKARSNGQKMGEAIVKARAYAGSLNAFFGDLPVAWVLLFYILISLALAVFKLIYRLVDLIKP